MILKVLFGKRKAFDGFDAVTLIQGQNSIELRESHQEKIGFLKDQVRRDR